MNICQPIRNQYFLWCCPDVTYPSSAWSPPPSPADPERGHWCRWSSVWQCRPGLLWSGCSGRSRRWRWINCRTEEPPAGHCPAPPHQTPSPPPAPAEPPSPPACLRTWTSTQIRHVKGESSGYTQVLHNIVKHSDSSQETADQAVQVSIVSIFTAVNQNIQTFQAYSWRQDECLILRRQIYRRVFL